MNRNQAAYLRAVRAALAKMGKPERFDANRAIKFYDRWLTATQAAASLAA